MILRSVIPILLCGLLGGCNYFRSPSKKPNTTAFDLAHWGWAKFGYTLAKPFTQTIRRRDKKNSSDQAYLAFVKKDPLHCNVLSFEYLEDLYAWEKQIRNDPVWLGSVLIIQGDADKIVDWKYNLDFLRAKIQHPDIHLVPGARHQLANEREELRNPVFDLIFNRLRERGLRHPLHP